MNGAIRVIEKLLTTDRKSRQGFRSRVMARIGLGGRKSPGEGRLCSSDSRRSVKRFARIPAIPDHVQATVPHGGKIGLELNVRLDQSDHTAELGHHPGRRHDRRTRNRKFVPGLRHERSTWGFRLDLRRIRQHRAAPIRKRGDALRRDVAVYREGESKAGGCHAQRGSQHENLTCRATGQMAFWPF
jgi:hypothetical protein